MTKFTNVEKFEAWVKRVMKNECYDFDAILSELEDNYGCNAYPEYEMESSCTKSGHPECYSYNVVDTFYLNGVEVDDGEDFDNFDREFIF